MRIETLDATPSPAIAGTVSSSGCAFHRPAWGRVAALNGFANLPASPNAVGRGIFQAANLTGQFSVLNRLLHPPRVIVRGEMMEPGGVVNAVCDLQEDH